MSTLSRSSAAIPHSTKMMMILGSNESSGTSYWIPSRYHRRSMAETSFPLNENFKFNASLMVPTRSFLLLIKIWLFIQTLSSCFIALLFPTKFDWRIQNSKNLKYLTTKLHILLTKFSSIKILIPISGGKKKKFNTRNYYLFKTS